MSFPVYIPIGPWRIHPHLFFESLSYFIGFRVYLALRRRAGDTVIVPYRWATLSCAAAGAALGARGLAWLANPDATYDLTSVLLGGKTIVGGLIGGLIGVELVKLAMGIRRSTFVVDGQGVVRKAWKRVDVQQHDQQVLDALSALGAGVS